MTAYALTAADRQRLFAAGVIGFAPRVLSRAAEQKRQWRSANPERSRELNRRHQQEWRRRHGKGRWEP